MKITKYFIEHFKLTNLILALIILAGSISILTLPRQDSPNISFNILTINTFYPGASPEDVEINVTDPIEDELESVDGIEEMSSYSIEGMSYIVVQLDPDAKNTDQIMNDIRNAVDRISDLPVEVTERPLINEMKSTDFPVLEVAVIGEDNKEDLLRKIAKDLESELKSLKSVGVIEKINYRKREVKILCDSKKMEESNVSFSKILGAIRSRNVKLSGGTLESFVDEKKVVTFSEFNELKDVGDVIVRSNFSGKNIVVTDIAEVKEGFKKKSIFCRSNGINSINLVVKRKGTTDVIKLSDKANSIIKKYHENYKGEGVSVIKVVDYSYYTRSLLNIVGRNAFFGFILVVISLFIFLNFRTAFWVALGIPLSVFGAYVFLPLFGISTNQITLITMIMVLGMLVDDAIVIAENINRHIEAGLDPKSAALKGTSEVFYPVLATIATTMLCFVPMFFMKGILGKFVIGIPIVVILTLLMSLFESVTLLPAHLAHSKISKTKENYLIAKFRFYYTKFLRKCLQRRYVTLGVILIIVITSVTFFSKVSKFNLFPTEDFDLFYIVMETKMGTSLNETSKKVKKVEEVISKITPDLMVGYKTIVGNHATDEMVTDPTLHENWALITVFLHPASKRNRRSEDLIEELKKSINKTEFTKLEVREMQDGPPVGLAITIRIVSDDFNLCELQEKDILKYLNNIKGVYDIDTSNKSGKEEIRLKLNYDTMAKVGITAIDVSNAVRIAYDGRVATTIRRDGEEIDFRVLLRDDQRGSQSILNELQIPNDQNKLIKVKNIAFMEKGEAKQSILHFNGKKAISITAKVNDDITSKEANLLIKKEFEKKISAMPGIEIVFGGEEKETMESMQNFYFAFICGLLAIYSILVLLLDSYIQPFLIMIAIPFGFIGVFIAFIIHDLPISFIGMIGALGMMGVVVNDSLVMVTYLNTLHKKYNTINVDIIIEGARTRLRPVLLTTITTVLGLLPTVYGFGGTEPFLVPMVLAMSWGLMFATFITLILVPVLYSFLQRDFHVKA